MKKITYLATAIIAFALMFCLVGCSSESDSSNGSNGINLDKTVTNEGLTCKVSSKWNSNSYGDVGYYISEYTSEDSSMVGQITSSSNVLYETTEEYYDAFISYAYTSDTPEYINVASSEIKNTVIDGASCAVYEYSWDWRFTNEENYSHTDGCIAYILAPEMIYEIQFAYDDCVSIVEAILDTVSIDAVTN